MIRYPIMLEQEQTQSSIEIPNDSIIDWIVGSNTNADADADAKATPQPSSAARLLRVPRMVSEKHDYEKYFVPQAVSIGPYYFGEPKLQSVEELKPVMAMKLFSNDKQALIRLYEKLSEPEMVKDLRNFYEENSTTRYCDKVFVKMMLLDACFIFYFINCVFIGEFKVSQSLFMSFNQIFSVCEDLFLLENQIPFKLQRVVMSFTKNYGLDNIHHIISHILPDDPYWKPKRRWLESILCIRSDQRSSPGQHSKSELFDNEPDHLLHILHRSRTPQHAIIDPVIDLNKNYKYKSSNFPSVNQLLDVGIRFKRGDTNLEDVKFSKGWCGFSAAVQLPRITLVGYTKPVLLNIIAYEMCLGKEAWVTSYVSLLHSLIANHEDVKVLRKSGVLGNFLGTDNEVVEFFNEIATDVVPRNSTYISVKNKIQSHYEGWSNTPISELTHEYRKSPWKFISLLGASIALFLTAVQTYFTVWARK